MAEPERPAFITDDGEVILIPDFGEEDHSTLFYFACQDVLRRIWDNPQDDAAWNHLAEEDNAHSQRL